MVDENVEWACVFTDMEATIPCILLIIDKDLTSAQQTEGLARFGLPYQISSTLQL